MRRDELEHIIRAAGDVLGDAELIVGGSQAILAVRAETELPPEATLSNEVDVLPLNDRDGRKADLIDSVLGEGSQFHATHHVYADGIGAGTMTLPRGWRRRLIRLENENTSGVAGLCLEPHDLAVSKLVAGRDKDLRFVRSLLASGVLDRELLLQRAARTRLTPEQLAAINHWLTERQTWTR